MKTIKLTKGQHAIVDDRDYDELIQFRWHAIWGSHTQSYYAQRQARLNGKWVTESMHRQVLGLRYGDKGQADHVNHHTLDNRRKNLRVATHGQNSVNRRKNSNNTSGLKGVSFHKPRRKWVAYIQCNNKKRNLGYFATKKEAYLAYCKAAIKYHGQFACST